MGRPAFEPTVEQRKTVKTLAAYGVTINDICQVIGISAPTLRLHFGHELATGGVEANAKVAETLFKQATREINPNVTAAIFWMKARAGWRDNDAAPGKKALADAGAMTAGQASEWGDDLTYSGDLPN